ncbi:MAG: hypothetical protein LBT90_01210 [Holosporaceae bacterium]|jgi:hypothetical protein|nr:hypothetical protein [Holosporaceae bacterium]
MKDRRNNNQKSRMSHGFYGRLRGSVLLEFAVAIPVLVMIMYFVLDSLRSNELDKKMDNIAYFAASMIQNISKNNANRLITLRDIRHITYATFMPMYFGTQPFCVGGDKYQLGYVPLLAMACVKGNIDSKATVVWAAMSDGFTATTPETFLCVVNNPEIASLMKLSYTIGQSVDPKSIHPNLMIRPGEMKLIICTCIFTNSNFKYGNGEKVNDNPKKLFGFRLLPVNIKGSDNSFLHSYVIIQPNSNVFNETPPA